MGLSKREIKQIENLTKEGKTPKEISEEIFGDQSKKESVRYHYKKFKVAPIEVHKAGSKFAKALEENGLGTHDWAHGWLKVDGASIHIRNEKAFDGKKVIDSILDKIREHTVDYEKIEYKKEENSYCQIIDLADHHFGKYSTKEETGKDYNLEIASKRFREGVTELLELTKGFHKDKIIFVIGNDVLHTDTPHRKTTAGTPQDTDGQWHEAFEHALAAHVEAIETLQRVAPVEVIYNPSNHDFMSGYMFAQTLKAWFHKNPNITFDCKIRHRKYTTYGTSLLGFNHGDGAKEKDMGIIMATEEPELWANSKHRYIYLHHVHHKIAKDQIGVTVEYMRSAASTDAWHDRQGYVSKQAVDSILISKDRGQVGRFTHWF